MKKALLATTALSVFYAASVSGATLYGTTTSGNLIRFNSATPGTIESTLPITGLSDRSETVHGIDFRPLTGQLFALTRTGQGMHRLYTLSTATGAATPVGEAQELSANFWGFDFNPTVDRIRLIGNDGSSLRFNPNTGAIAANDTSTSVNGISAVAYDRNDTNGATPTTLFGISTTTGGLVRIGGVDGNPSPNAGAVTPIGLLGIEGIGGFASFDIHSDGTAWLGVMQNPIAPVRGFIAVPRLYSVNLSTGAASLVGNIGGPQSQFILTGLAAIPEPATASALALAALALTARRRRA